MLEGGSAAARYVEPPLQWLGRLGEEHREWHEQGIAERR